MPFVCGPAGRLMRALAKVLHRLAEFGGDSLRHFAGCFDGTLHNVAERVDRRRGRRGRSRQSAWKPSTSLRESLSRLAGQVYFNLRAGKRSRIKDLVDVCVMALESSTVNDAYMARRLCKHRARHQQADESIERIQLPQKKSSGKKRSSPGGWPGISPQDNEANDPHFPTAAPPFIARQAITLPQGNRNRPDRKRNPEEKG